MDEFWFWIGIGILMLVTFPWGGYGHVNDPDNPPDYLYDGKAEDE